jgi:hypothetical protein
VYEEGKMSAENVSTAPVPHPPKRATVNKNNFSIALPEDQMFTRVLIGRIARQKELKVTTISGKEVVGFIIGLDHEWLQLTTTVGQMQVIVQLLNVASIEETGLALWNMDVDNYEGLGGQEGKERIERFAQTVYERARDAQKMIYHDRRRESYYND